MSKFSEQNDALDPLLTICEVAQLLRVDDTTVRRWIKLGALQGMTLPHAGKRRVYRVYRSSIDAILVPRIMSERQIRHE